MNTGENMHTKSNIICPHLIGSPEGAICSFDNELVRNMRDADIRLCMNRRYESCSIYVRLLQKEAIKRISPDAVPETP